MIGKDVGLCTKNALPLKTLTVCGSNQFATNNVQVFVLSLMNANLFLNWGHKILMTKRNMLVISNQLISKTCPINLKYLLMSFYYSILFDLVSYFFSIEFQGSSFSIESKTVISILNTKLWSSLWGYEVEDIENTISLAEKWKLISSPQNYRKDVFFWQMDSCVIGDADELCDKNAFLSESRTFINSYCCSVAYKILVDLLLWMKNNHVDEHFF